MAKKDQEKEVEEQEPLTEEQRITRLEKKVGTNKFVLFGIALFLIIIISISVTIFSVIAFQDTEEVSDPAVSALQLEVAELKKQLSPLDSKINNLSQSIPALKGQLANTQNAVIASVMLEQEKSFQKFLATLQSGTYDLAHMVPGSRTWLEQYSEQISLATQHSKMRIQSLEKLNSGEAVANDDPFFGDDF
jgi:tetrahydromethanopterin S-methyltransferase subunit G